MQAFPTRRLIFPLLRLGLLGVALGFSGCDFFLPPELPSPDGQGELATVLSCGGGPVSVNGMQSGDELEVRVESSVSVQIRRLFSSSSHGVRLRVELDSGEVERTLEIWDSVGGERVLPAPLDAGSVARLELIALDGASLQGSVSMTCSSAAELCSDLNDNDLDGAADCADLDCARDEGCEADQEDFFVQNLECQGEFFELGPTMLGPLDDQRSHYLTFPGGTEAPPEEFWGGAEVVFVAGDSGTLSLELPADGMMCWAPAGSVGPVPCEESISVEAGSQSVGLLAGQALWLEPLGVGWDVLTASYVCEGGS